MFVVMRKIQAAVMMAVAALSLSICDVIRADVTAGSKDLFRCRQSCYQKFVADWHHCMDFDDCKNMCITPPNINSYIPEAFSFLCWNNCDQLLGPFPLNINSALRQGSLVLTDIAWDQAITNASKQCLVTWEVLGGGLMGNLLTDSSTVELSLWPDTVYHVQVTCKHKETGGMRRSYKLIVDTHKLSEANSNNIAIATGIQSIAIDTSKSLSASKYDGGNANTISHDVASASSASISSNAENDSRMRILKDNSKDFLTPYNPNAIAKEVDDKRASKHQQSEQKPQQQQESLQQSSILRQKLDPGVMVYGKEGISDVPDAQRMAAEFLNESIIFAVVGSVVVFCGLLMLYAFTRPVAGAKPACLMDRSYTVDREVLIHSEMLPSQTPAAMASTSRDTSTAAAAAAGCSTSLTSAAAAPAVDSRTLHV